MADTPKIALIISSTRDSRFADKPAAWLLKQMQARDDLAVELVDLKDFDLPFFNEVASNLWTPSQDPRAVAWQRKVGEFDGYVFLVAEYNRSVTGALKNALDQCYKEWNRKPMAAFGYGSVGAARAIEQLRLMAVELQMPPIRNGVHLSGSDFFKVSPLGGNGAIEDVEKSLAGPTKAMLDELAWYASALKAARG